MRHCYRGSGVQAEWGMNRLDSIERNQGKPETRNALFRAACSIQSFFSFISLNGMWHSALNEIWHHPGLAHSCGLGAAGALAAPSPL